jgi:hypothetical protein
MLRVEESIAEFACAGPAVFEPHEAFAIEPDGCFCATSSAKRSLVPHWIARQTW